MNPEEAKVLIDRARGYVELKRTTEGFMVVDEKSAPPRMLGIGKTPTEAWLNAAARLGFTG